MYQDQDGLLDPVLAYSDRNKGGFRALERLIDCVLEEKQSDQQVASSMHARWLADEARAATPEGRSPLEVDNPRAQLSSG